MRSWSAPAEPDGLTAVALEIHLSLESAAPLEANERLADAGGALAEGVADLASEAVCGIGSQFAALLGDVLEDSVAQGFDPNGVERTAGGMGCVSHTGCVPPEAVRANPQKARIWFTATTCGLN
jgi:hypothetical protein